MSARNVAACSSASSSTILPPIEQPSTTGRSRPERTAEGQDQVDVPLRRQPVLLVLPADGRQRLAVPRHVEGEHAEVPRDLGVVQQVAPLAIVGAGGVQAHERDALPGFLDVEAMGAAAEVEPEVATDDRLVRRPGSHPPARGWASTSFT